MDEPILRVGSQGDWVYYLQQLLSQAGYDPGGLDGDFGSGTLAALQAFQNDYGLDVDGVAGPATWAALTGEATPVEDGSGSDAVPDWLVTAGAPANLADWSEEEKEAYFEGSVSEGADGGVPEDVPLLVMNDVPSDGEVIA